MNIDSMLVSQYRIGLNMLEAAAILCDVGVREEPEKDNKVW
jgi:hypothetical protein